MDLEILNCMQTTAQIIVMHVPVIHFAQLVNTAIFSKTLAKVYGYVFKPEACKKVRGDQFFFVNNRFIKSPALYHAINSSYSNRDILMHQNLSL